MIDQILRPDLLIFILGGAAAGLVAWGAARTEIRFIWRDLRRLDQADRRHEKRLTIIERRTEL